MRPRPFVIALAASLLSAATVAAQITTSTITGRVVSASGAPVAGVTVAATYGPTGARYGTQTRDDGRFTLANLRAGGPYKIETRRIGYRQETREKIFVALGTEMRVDFNLEEAATTLAAVTVTAGLGSNVFDSRRTGTQTSVDQRQIENVPTLSRGLQDVTKLTPSGNANSFGGTNGVLPPGSPACPSGTLLRAYMPKNFRSSGIDGLNFRYCAGMIWSVSMLSPRTYALPLMIDCIKPLCGQSIGAGWVKVVGGREP